MLQQVAALAVGRHGDLRPRPLVHPLQLVAAGMAGDVDARMVALGVEAHAAVGELVLQVADRDLVAGDDPRGEDAGVALRPGFTCGWVPSAMRDSAARGSPWLPVQR